MQVRRPTTAHVWGVVACTVTVVVVASTAYGPRSPVGLLTRQSVAGTCHAAADPDELTATSSDTAPAVPCNRPHQTETLWVEQITGPLAAEKRRPNPELLNATLSSRCGDYWHVRSVMGADPYDSHWGITTLMKVPTPAEWGAGNRTLRCDAAGGSQGRGGPSLSDTLRGILRRADSAVVRLCRSGGSRLTCDLPHDAETMSPEVALDWSSWPGNATATALARAACTPIAEQYLGALLSTRPDLVVDADVPSEAQWDGGMRQAGCWLVNASLQPTTGTVRGGLR